MVSIGNYGNASFDGDDRTPQPTKGVLDICQKKPTVRRALAVVPSGRVPAPSTLLSLSVLP